MVKTADKIKGVTLVIGGDATTLGKELKSVNSESKSLNSELRSIKSGLKFSPDSVVLLNQKTQVAAEQTEALKKKQDILKQALSQVQEQAARGDLGADKVREVEREYIKVTSQLKNLKAEGEKPVLSGWQKSFKNLAESSKKTTSEVSAHFQNLKSSIMGAVAGTGLVLGIKTLATTISGLADTASDLSEAQNVVEQTFKSSSGAVKEWSTTLAKSAGISQTDATSMVGTMGAMMKSSGIVEKSAASMSENLVQLTGDMSSFYNVGTSDMWEKIRSGISGETEPLKQLGINMSVANLQAFALSEGIKKPYDKMKQSEQTVLRYNYLLSVTKDAQGDFANTLDSSLANQSRVFKMNIEQMKQRVGQEFLPMMNDVYKELNPLVEQLMPDIAAGARQVAKDIMAHKTDIINTVKGIAGGIKEGYKFITEHSNDIKRVIEIGTVGLVAWKAALLACNAVASIYSGIQTVMAIKTAITTAAKGAETVATVTETSAQVGLNAVMAANPFGAVAVAVGALAAGITFLCTQTDESTNAVNEQVKAVNDNAQAWEDLKKQTSDQAATDLAEVDRTKELWDWLGKNVDATGKLTGKKEEAEKVIDRINKLAGQKELDLNNGMVDGYKKQKEAIEKLIEQKKAKILLDANETKYKKALENTNELEMQQADIYNKITPLAAQIADTKNKIAKAQEAEKSGDYLSYDMVSLRKTLAQQQENYNALNSAYDTSENQLKEYYSTVKDYEDASAEFAQEHYDKSAQILDDGNRKLLTAGEATKEQLKQQADDAEIVYLKLNQEFANGEKGVTKNMVDGAKERAQKAYDEYNNFGVEAGSGLTNGVNSEKKSVSSAGKSMGNALKDGIKSGLSGFNAFQAGCTFAKNFNMGWEESLDSFSSPDKHISVYQNRTGHNAHGTSFWTGGATWVGENGPEKIILPRGTSILPNHESLQLSNHRQEVSAPAVYQIDININGDNIFKTDTDINDFSNKIGLAVYRGLH